MSTLPDPEHPETPTSAPGQAHYDIFVPHPKAHEYSEAVNFQPPPYLIAFVKQILRTPAMNVDLYDKQADTVDWGGEVDYSGYEWFKDPPPRPEVRRLSPYTRIQMTYLDNSPLSHSRAPPTTTFLNQASSSKTRRSISR